MVRGAMEFFGGPGEPGAPQIGVPPRAGDGAGQGMVAPPERAPGGFMTATETYVRHCPKCGSVRVHRSRRRGPLERVLASLGAAICRCHDCCGRQAWFGL